MRSATVRCTESEAHPSADTTLRQRTVTALRGRIPMGRYGKAGEVSALVSYLCSKDAAYVTGQNIRIDAGLTRSL